ncbi:MAG: hypothetical protein WC889_11900 [Myxococcota bacterium]
MQAVRGSWAKLIFCAVLMLAWTMGCAGGGGCSGGCGGLEKLEKPMAKADLANRPVQARIASPLFEFLEDPKNIEELLKMFMPDGLVFDVPATELKIAGDCVPVLCQGGCKLRINILSLKFTMTDPDKIDVLVKAQITDAAGTSFATLVLLARPPYLSTCEPFYYFFLPEKCNLELRTGSNVPLKKDLTANLKFTIDANTGYLSFDAAASMLIDLKNDLQVTDCGGYTTIVDIIQFLDPYLNFSKLINDMLKTQIDKLINDQLGALKCLSCDTFLSCPTGYTCEASSNLCKDAGGVCYPNPLGIEGRLDVGALLASIVPGKTSTVDLAVVAGQFDQPAQDKIVENSGVSLSVMAGTLGTTDTCVPVVPPPPLPINMIPEADSQGKNKAAFCPQCNPANDKCPTGTTCDAVYRVCKTPERKCAELPFMAGIGVHDYMLSRVFWQAFNAGALCIGMDTRAIYELTKNSGTPINLNAGLLGAVVPEFNIIDGSAPLLILLRPQKPPVARIGAGITKVVVVDGKETLVIEEPLLTVVIQDLAMDFYMAAFNRWTRVFTMTADVVLPVGLEVVPGKDDPNKIALQVVLGDIKGAIQNLRVTNSELVATSPEAIKGVFGLIFSIIPLDKLGDISFDIPDLAGFALNIMAIKGEKMWDPADEPAECKMSNPGPRVGQCYQFLSFYANIGLAPTTPPAPVRTVAGVAEVVTPPIEQMRLIGTDGEVAPSVVLDVSGGGDGLEHQYRVDGGSWSFFMPGKSITVQSRLFFLQGKHTIQVRAREIAEARTLDVEGVKLEVLIDALPPEISLAADRSGNVTVSAKDLVTDAASIKMQYRVNGGGWMQIENGQVIPSSVADMGEIEISAVDEKGLESVSKLVRPVSGGEEGEAEIPAQTMEATGNVAGSTGCSCSSVEL